MHFTVNASGRRHRPLDEFSGQDFRQVEAHESLAAPRQFRKPTLGRHALAKPSRQGAHCDQAYEGVDA